MTESNGRDPLEEKIDELLEQNEEIREILTTICERLAEISLPFGSGFEIES